MHAPTSPATTLAVLATPRPAGAARDETEQNGTFRNADAQNAFPIFTPPIAGTQRVPGPAAAATALSPRQLTAISLLCAGLNLDTVAARLRLGRTTLYRWRTTHPAFRAELHRRQRDLHDTAARRLRLTLLRALQVVNHEVTRSRHQENRVKAALALLRHLDLSDLLAPPTALTADHCADELVRGDRRSRNLDPTLPVTDDDRDLLFASLAADDADPDDDPLPPTHRRLRGAPDAPPAPCPTRGDAPSPDPDFQI